MTDEVYAAVAAILKQGAATRGALGRLSEFHPLPLAAEGPVRVRMRVADVTTRQILEAIPGVEQADGYTVAVAGPRMGDACRLIRLMYRFVSIGRSGTGAVQLIPGRREPAVLTRASAAPYPRHTEPRRVGAARG